MTEMNMGIQKNPNHKTEETHTLNIIVSRTATTIGKMIRGVIGGNYNHCSFYIDGDVSRIYGFSRRYTEFWFTGCFTQENAVHFEEYQIYAVPVEDEKYQRLSEKITEMKSHTNVYGYLNALMLPAGISVDSDNGYICSTFAADLIDKYTEVVPEKAVNLHSPTDIFELMEKAVEARQATRVNIELPKEKDYTFLKPATRWKGDAFKTGAGVRGKAPKALLLGNAFVKDSTMLSHVGDLIRALIRKGWQVTVPPQSGAGREEEQLEELLADADRVICCGGDRELSGCADKVLRLRTDVPIALIPLGTTNDFAKTMEIPTDISKAMEVAAAGTVRRVDSGSLLGRNFAYVAGFGDVAQASHKTSDTKKRIMGYGAYVLSGAGALLKMKEYEVRLIMDGIETEGKYLMALITNASMAGGIKVWDQISPDDGKFEVLLVKKPKASNVLGAVETYSASHIAIENLSPDPLEWVLDGNPGAVTQPGETVEINVKKQSYSIVTGGEI